MIIPINFPNTCCWLKMEKSVPVHPVKEQRQPELGGCLLSLGWYAATLAAFFCSLLVCECWDYCTEEGCRGHMAQIHKEACFD